ncbi:MAG TPA: NAD(P)-dependent oxidoreductase [Stellaceae bacterium]|nr:NAD(P)-dependent oxidoreductase [Stellaceae bacterium]
MAAIETLGFIGLGVMGEPMCENLARKSKCPIYATDLRRMPLSHLEAAGVNACGSVADVAESADLIFLSLPGGKEVEEVCCAIIASARRRTATVVDCSTSPVRLTREVASRCNAVGIAYADAPVARTREAAQKGTLSIMVGAAPELFQSIRPHLECMGSDVTLCGPAGCGQVVKLLNNMMLFEIGSALAEALAIGRRSGVDERLLLDTLSKGSSDSFALRNHGMKAMLPRRFPEDAFGTDYARKDLAYALELAREAGVAAEGAQVVQRRLDAASDRGYGRNYWPVILNVVDPDTQP